MLRKFFHLIFLLTFFAFAAAMLANSVIGTDDLVPARNNQPCNSNHVMIMSIKLVDAIPVIESVRIQPGRLNEDRQTRQPARIFGLDERSTLVFYDSTNKVIFDTAFDYPIAKTVPIRLPGSEDDGTPDVIFLDEPETFLVVPYFKGIEFVEIYNPHDMVPVVVKQFTELNACYEPYTDTLLAASQPTPAESGKFHILIIASGFSSASMTNFKNRAAEVKNFILGREPFKLYSSLISVHIHENTANLGCAPGCAGIDRLMCCSGSKVLSAAAASGYLYDEILVIHNTSTYSGGGYRENLDAYKVKSYNTYAMVYSGSYCDEMALHEMGHSFGNLCDEYTYGSEGYAYSLCVNCRSACNDWAAISTACQQSCDAKSNYYRPEDSIMLALNFHDFNPVSIQSTYLPDGLLERLQFFLNYTNLPPVFDTPIGTVDGREGALISFKAAATDPESDPITYGSVNLPPGATFDKDTADFSWTPSYTDSGTYRFKLGASDGKNTIKQQVTVNVKNVKAVKK